jgi:hypothetical protein
MKRRNRVMLMWVLTGIWLCVQSPWAHAQRMQAHAHSLEHAVAQLAADPAAEHCHGDELPQSHPLPQAPEDPAGCCADGHCDGLCAQLSFGLAATTPRLIVQGVVLFAPMQVAGVQSMRQPELFRPPI